MPAYEQKITVLMTDQFEDTSPAEEGEEAAVSHHILTSRNES